MALRGRRCERRYMMESTRVQAEITLGTTHFKEANEQVRAALARADAVTIREANAQRYLG